jgi:hypothetical protein
LLSSVIDNQFPHVQATDTELVDLDDAEAGVSDRQAADEQAAEGKRANRDSSDGESSDCEGADALGFGRLRTDRLGADCSRADRCRRRASREPFFHALLHIAFVRVMPGGCPFRPDAQLNGGADLATNIPR